MTGKHFYFTLAPVQSFVSQARRTRDFWAGSFLLSWLSAVAMKSVEAQNGIIDFPAADRAFLNWLEGKETGEKPEQGSVPNRFKAMVKDNFKPENVVKSVQIAWEALATDVYNGDLSHVGVKTKHIWDRQINSFWDMNWVLSDEVHNSALDQRKNWRSYRSPEEAGVKCMMMTGWQELSGEKRPNEKALKKFWGNIISQGKKGIKTDLRDNEYLCAIALVKRRFSRYFEHLEIQEMPDKWRLKGWKVDAGRPSVSYMAAVHWLEAVLKETKNSGDINAQFEVFHTTACQLMGSAYSEWANDIACIKNTQTNKKWQALDGNVFFESVLENINTYPEQNQASTVLQELKKLKRLLNESTDQFIPISPFYAVLMMDGDSLGTQMSVEKKQKTITNGLEKFTQGVGKIIKRHNGFLIYAGGDDVLAILPLEDALDCALAVRQDYEKIFKDLNQKAATNERVETTISAAIEYAHIKMPLTKVFQDAHKLLDDIAKNTYGRDSIAVRVWKPGGKALEWGMPWNFAIDSTSGKEEVTLQRLANQYFVKEGNEYGQLSNTFLYKIRERFDLLNPDNAQKPVLSEEEGIDLMAAEFFSSGLCKSYMGDNKMREAKALVTPLLKQCRPVYRDKDKPEKDWGKDDKMFVDAALLVRFLAQKGVNV
ncbi:MAG: type III-B CRISPR-associated protein Cas10/Cmr2 [Methylococcales bacterium]|nr:type III-B CRISPR-associated protein Cas10/Cmr2 [Methylococcales bacterium]